MSEPSFSNSFVFNPLIDPDVINNLYENDYQYIEEIFNTALTHIIPDIEQIRSAYASGDLEGLRKSVHKIKPTFGFLGIPGVEERCKGVEDKCRTVQTTGELGTEVDQLLLLINQAHKALEEDYQKLIIHNKP